MAKYRRKPVAVEVTPHIFDGKETGWIETIFPNGTRLLMLSEELAEKYEPADVPTELERLTALVEKMRVCLEANHQCPSAVGLKDVEKCWAFIIKCQDCWQAALDTANV